jgi:cytochrome b6-f complex iron-sulfur subunit
MSTALVVIIVIAVLVVLAALVLFASARRVDTRRGAGALSRETVRRDRSETAPLEREPVPVGGRAVERAAIEERTRSTELVPAADLAPAPYVPPDKETVDFTRRQFFNRSMITLMSVGLGGFGASLLAFLWPKLSGGFGSKVNVGKLDDILSQIRSNKNFLYLAEARTWMTEYPKAALPKAQAVYVGPVYNGMEQGLNALYQKCPHLGCRVPNCDSSQWFECPCHGSQYNRVGEKKGGPAPRGMDRFGIVVSGGSVVVDTGTVFLGPAIGVNTTGQEAEGPHCVGGSAE